MAHEVTTRPSTARSSRATSRCSSTSGPSGAGRATPSRPCSTDRRGAQDELKLVKVNIDEEPEIAQRYGVMSIPTMILFRDGEPSAAAIGAQPKGDIKKPARTPDP